MFYAAFYFVLKCKTLSKARERYSSVNLEMFKYHFLMENVDDYVCEKLAAAMSAETKEDSGKEIEAILNWKTTRKCTLRVGLLLLVHR